MRETKKIFLEQNFPYLIIGELIFLFLAFSFGFNFLLNSWTAPNLKIDGQEFSNLAESILEGRLDLGKYPDFKMDCSIVGEKCFWALGPFPAVVLLPFVFLFKIIGLSFYQGYLNFFLTLAVFILAWAVARKFHYSFRDSLWLAFAFCFASVYLGIALHSASWYFAQAITVVLLILSIYEYLNKKRYWLVGLYFAFIFATRFSAGFGILFFVLSIFSDKKLDFKSKIQQLLVMFLPIVISGVLLLYYNFVRFGNPFDNGYGRASVGVEFLQKIRERYGLFNPQYFFTNLYYYFIKTPEPLLWENYLLVPPYLAASPLGLSFFIVSPIFIKMFWADLNDQMVKFCWLTSLIILFILLIYYNSGFWQFGPRYILDLLPFWFLILLQGFKDFKLNFSHWLIITLSAFFNFFLFLTLL